METTKFKSVIAKSSGMFALVLIVLVNLNSIGYAQDSIVKIEKHLNFNKKMNGSQTGLIKQLPGITDEQKKQIKDFKVQQMKEMLPLKNQLGEKKAHLKTLETSDTPDMKAINQLIDEMGSIQVSMRKKQAEFTQKVRKILTDEQRILFDTFKDSKKGQSGKKIGK
jgi:Spy/CpxP family protein refolding chaperone